ncbi:MAG: DUF6438 domain-containing protein [Terricaulis sp.]
MGFVHAVAGFAAALALAACAPLAPTTPEGNPVTQTNVVISLARSACYGFCPIYTVAITGEGDVTYVGHGFVNVVGEQRATIPRADVAHLLARFDAIGFDALRNEYRASITDIPTYTIALERNGRRKVVVDYGGPGAGMPASVRALEDEIDRVAGTARWVLRDGQPVRTRPAH